MGSLRKLKPRRFSVLELRSLFSRAGVPRLSVLHVKMAPGAEAPALFHRRTDEFFFVSRGSVSGRVAGRRRRFSAGDFCFLPAGTVHEFKAGPRGAEILDVFFPRFDLARPDVVLVR